MKKALTVLALAGAFTLGGASAASADDSYTVPPPVCSVSPASVTVGDSALVTCEFDDSFEGETVIFTVDGPAVVDDTLASIAFAAGSAGSSVEKVVTDGVATTTFRAPAKAVYEIDLHYGPEADALVLPIGVTVVGADGSLPVTGGGVPTEAIWIGVGAIALGGIAVFAAVARRRSHSHR